MPVMQRRRPRFLSELVITPNRRSLLTLADQPDQRNPWHRQLELQAQLAGGMSVTQSQLDDLSLTLTTAQDSAADALTKEAGA